MFEVFVEYLHGLFEILGCCGQSQLRWFEKQLEMRKRRNKRLAAAFVSALVATRPERAFWMCARSQDRIEIGTCTDEQWLANFHMRHRTFDFICGKLRTLLCKRCPHLHAAIHLIKRIALTILYLADFKTRTGETQQWMALISPSPPLPTMQKDYCSHKGSHFIILQAVVENHSWWVTHTHTHTHRGRGLSLYMYTLHLPKYIVSVMSQLCISSYVSLLWQ